MMIVNKKGTTGPAPTLFNQGLRNEDVIKMSTALLATKHLWVTRSAATVGLASSQALSQGARMLQTLQGGTPMYGHEKLDYEKLGHK
jgi:hypothetical protein